MAKIDEKDIKTDENGIKLYRPEDFEGMRRAGKLAAECLDYITDFVDAGERRNIWTICAGNLSFRIMRFPPVWDITAIRKQSAPRLTMSSAMAFPMTESLPTATLSILT